MIRIRRMVGSGLDCNGFRRMSAAIGRSSFVRGALLSHIFADVGSDVHVTPRVAEINYKRSGLMFMEANHPGLRGLDGFGSIATEYNDSARQYHHWRKARSLRSNPHSPPPRTGPRSARRVIVMLSVVALCGCAPQLSGANEAGGIVSGVRMHGLLANTSDAFSLADSSCRRYGKIARMDSRLNGRYDPDGTISFDCVSP